MATFQLFLQSGRAEDLSNPCKTSVFFVTPKIYFLSETYIYVHEQSCAVCVCDVINLSYFLCL